MQSWNALGPVNAGVLQTGHRACSCLLLSQLSQCLDVRWLSEAESRPVPPSKFAPAKGGQCRELEEVAGGWNRDILGQGWWRDQWGGLGLEGDGTCLGDLGWMLTLLGWSYLH